MKSSSSNSPFEKSLSFSPFYKGGEGDLKTHPDLLYKGRRNKRGE